MAAGLTVFRSSPTTAARTHGHKFTLTLMLTLTLTLSLSLTLTLTRRAGPVCLALWPHSQPSARARRLCEQARNLLLIAVLLFVFFPVAAQNNPALQAAR